MENEMTTGGQMNAQFVDRMLIEHPEFTVRVYEGCANCSAAILHASRGTAAERLAACPGRLVEEIGGKVVGFCRLPRSERTSD